MKLRNVMKYKNNKKLKILGICILIAIIGLIITLITVNAIKEKKEDEVALTLKDNLNTEFLSEVKVSSFIENLNGTLTDDYIIDTTSLGTKEVKVNYKNARGKKKHKTYEINVVDTEKPKIFLSSSTISVKKGYSKSLTSLFLSGDNCDPNPERTIIGDYDLNTVGKYNLKFTIKDASGNEASKDFTLKVFEPSSSSSNTTTDSTSNKNAKQFSDILAQYCEKNVKNENPSNTLLNNNSLNVNNGSLEYTNQNANDTTISSQNSANLYKEAGIDVSKWQGEIDWQKVKNAGCKFAFIRVGSQSSQNGDLNEDKYFKTNIENAISNGIEVGVYFYSCAQNTEEAEKQAKWVMDEIKNYKVTLPIVFDWEEWTNFADFGLSLYGINKVAEAFINTCKNNGYSGMLYSSKNYLTDIWIPEMFENIWLAQYASEVTYTKSYNFWQMCNTGRIDGISGDVDIDLRK